METSSEQCEVAADALRTSFRSGKSKSYEWRVTQLKGVLRFLDENEKLIKEAMAADLGRGFFEAVGLEILPVKMEIEHFLANLEKWMKPVFTPVPALMLPATSEYIYEPYGTVLVIGSFNYPILLTLSPVIGAIAAGNCVLIKPSELSRASENILSTVLPKYIDGDCMKVITGGVSTSSALLDIKWDKIFFTGSPRVGKIVATAAAKTLTPYTLELGGKSPTVIDKSVTDLGVAVRRIVWGKFGNAGQTCIAPDYVLCHASKYDEFLSTVKSTIQSFYGENPQKSEHLARIISHAHCERLKSYIEEKPGRVLVGGTVDVSDRYVAPTVITDVDMNSKLMKEEIFGPILPVLKYNTTEEVIELINSDSYEKPLSLYIFGNDRRFIDTVISSCPSGGVMVNDVVFHFSSVFIPFGGLGNSGQGSYHGKYTYHVHIHAAVHVRMLTNAAALYALL
jgi:aldehyde dehydrogenase (NAD+)